MTVIAITGGTSGLGYETARELATHPDVSQVIITGRNKERCEKAITALEALLPAEKRKGLGNSETFYQYKLIDLSDVQSIIACAKTWPDNVDKYLLNAGALGQLKINEKAGQTDSMVINTSGHALFIDQLLQSGKIKNGNHVIFVGSEIARQLYAMIPLVPQYCSFTEKDIDGAISKHYNGICHCIPIRKQMGDYKNSKIIGTMHFQNLAKENNGIYIITMSPGGAGGSFVDEAHQPVKCLLSGLPCMFYAMCITHGCSRNESVAIGTKRMTDILTDEDVMKKFPTGSIALSGRNKCPCLWGATGAMVDNRPFTKYFQDEELHKTTSLKLREYNAKWCMNSGIDEAPPQQVMGMSPVTGAH